MLLYKPIPTQHLLTHLGKKAFENIVGKGMLRAQAISPLPTMFCTLSKTNYQFFYI